MSSDKSRAVVPSLNPLISKEIELINRVEEMQLLKQAVDRAVQGNGGVVFLSGEAGIGKTRLARELGAYAHLQGIQVLSGRCPALFRMNGVPPYVLWNDVIRDYLENSTSEQLFKVIGYYPAEVAKLVPEVAQKLRVIPKSLPINPEHERNRVFEAVSQFVTNISRELPLLIILDDLQWADQSSLLLLHYLARGIHRESMLLLGAYRDVYVNEKHSLFPVLTELNRERLLQSVPLKRLSFNDASEMIKRILAQDDISTEFSKLVYEKTRGNPFFVEEVIKSLKEDEVIYRRRHEWKIKEISKIEFPKTVKSVIRARLSRLDEESQRVLTLASFIGKDFTFETLRLASDIEEDRLVDIMEKLLKTSLVKEEEVRGVDVYSFVDIIVRDVAYDEVSRLRRKRLHKAVGLALEKQYAKKIDEHFGELAYHFLESGDKDKALDYFSKAGEKAQEVHAHDEAFAYFQHTLALLEEQEGDLEQRVRTMETLGDLKGWTGESEACTEYWTGALSLWDQLGDKKNLARLHGKIANRYWMWTANKDKASEHHQAALKILEAEPESLVLAGVYEDISHMLWRTGESAKALPWTRKAVEMAKRLSDSEVPRARAGVLARCYNNLGVFSEKSGDTEKAQEYLHEGLKLSLEYSFVPVALAFYNNLSEFQFSVGELQKSFETAKEGMQFARKVGALSSLAWNGSVQAMYHVNMGEIPKAISMLEGILELDRKIKFTAHLPYAMWGLGVCSYWLGEYAKSLHYLMEARDIARKTGEYQAHGLATGWLGELYLEMNDYVQAENCLNETKAICERTGETIYQFNYVFPALAKLYLKKGEIEKAEKLIEETYRYAVKTKNRLILSYAEMLKAMVLNKQKKWKQSTQHFEKSWEEHRFLNTKKWLAPRFAEFLYEYASMLLDRKDNGDKEKAHLLLHESLNVYQKMDARRKGEKVRSRMASLETGQQLVSEPGPATVESSRVATPGHVATGYGDLNDLLFGGIPRNYAVMLTSPSCDERNLLIRKFLEAGTKDSQVTFYITTKIDGVETLAEKFQSNLYVLICNPQADKILKSLPNILTLKGVENLTDINIALSSAIRKLSTDPERPRRICLEIISDVLLQHHAVNSRRWLNALIPELKSKGFTILAVMDPQMHPPQEARAILDLFEGEIGMYEKETDKGLQKFLKIRKMYNQRYLENELLVSKENLRK